MRYWLMKSEPSVYSIHDLEESGNCCWDGVRNYQARNFMRDAMSIGDNVLFYHSNTSPPGVAGVAKVCRSAYPDHTAFDPKSDNYDPRSDIKSPVWMMVDLSFIETFPSLVSLETIRSLPACSDMPLLQKGQRLSVLPIEKQHFEAIVRIGRR